MLSWLGGRQVYLDLLPFYLRRAADVRVLKMYACRHPCVESWRMAPSSNGLPRPVYKMTVRAYISKVLPCVGATPRGVTPPRTELLRFGLRGGNRPLELNP